MAVSRSVPQKKCLDMLMTAGLYTAAEAERFGLVNRVFPDTSLAQDTLAWAREIARSSKYSIAMAKQVFYAQ